MKRVILIATAVLAFSLTALGQEPAKKDQVVPTVEQQQIFADAQTKAQRAYQEWKASGERADALPTKASMKDRIEALFDVAEGQHHYDVATGDVRVTIYYIMATLKISPAEYESTIDKNGILSFIVKAKPVVKSGQKKN